MWYYYRTCRRNKESEDIHVTSTTRGENRRSKLLRLEANLARARSSIKKAALCCHAGTLPYLYEPESFNTHATGPTVVDYIHVIASKHPYWNRSLGAGHFMLSCHDWVRPHASSYVPHLFHKSIGVLCNANTSEGFDLAEDASFPEINLVTGEVEGLLGGPSLSHRSTFAFFAGGLHGYISYVPPFSDVLNWNSYCVQVAVKDIPNIKKILVSFSQGQYIFENANQSAEAFCGECNTQEI
ncbi:hypothetical protein DITRI_Ditri11bG0050700 [Diplodiscus trichospermus]